MKKLLLTAVMTTATLAAAAVGNTPDGVKVTDFSLDRLEKRVAVSMNLDLNGVRLNSNRELTITPVLRSADGKDSIVFDAVKVCGRNFYLLHQRRDDMKKTPFYRAGQNVKVAYTASADNAPWIDDSQLYLSAKETGCRNCLEAVWQRPLGAVFVPSFTPQFNFVRPVGNAGKERNIEGSAFIDFKVNQTDILPAYRRNSVELAKITATIDSVRQDPDITIKSIAIKGFASPEGSYSNNERLAKGRTEALAGYVADLYRFPAGVMTTSFEPEDWEGLIRWLENSNIDNRDEILQIARNTSLPPDPRNTEIQKRFPTQYRFLLENVYPALRHSDYRIDYLIRSFTSPEEILQILKTDPGKLSPDEFYVAAATLTPGSPEYNELFETCVRLYPDDVASNINAANTAMRRGEYAAAEKYLAKGGDEPVAVYSRGVLAALQGDWTAAESFFSQAAKLKVADAPAALETVRQIISKLNNPNLLNK